MLNTDGTSALAYAFLYLTVLALWLPTQRRIPFWTFPLILSIILGYAAGHLTLSALVPIILQYGSARLLKQAERPWLRGLASGVLMISGIGLGAHLFPGFHNWKVIDGVLVSQDAIPFTLYLNFDKTLVGIVILAELHERIRTREAWAQMLRYTLSRAPLVIAAVAALSFVFQYVRWDPKIPDILPLWAWTNLLFVCVAEEGFFRGFLQKYLAELWQDLRFGKLMALVFAALAFGVAHLGGGLSYVILSAVAGLGYGWMYRATQRIEASIITHFLLNVFHILMLTYPALVPAT
jgi:membrane protease YdiL (CAAX protease family)